MAILLTLSPSSGNDFPGPVVSYQKPNGSEEQPAAALVVAATTRGNRTTKSTLAFNADDRYNGGTALGHTPSAQNARPKIRIKSP